MTQPLVPNTNRVLMDVLIAYMQGEDIYTAEQVFPAVPVDDQTRQYYVFGKDTFLSDKMEMLGDNEETAGSGFTLSADTYMCNPWGTHVDLGAITKSRVDEIFDAESAATRICAKRVLLRKERAFVTNHFTTSVWGTDVVGSTDFTQWSDPTSDPEADIGTGRTTVLQNTGYKPNQLTLGHPVFEALKRHPLIKDQFKHTSASSITREMMASFFELDRINVAEAVYVDSVEGATITTAFTHGKHALLSYSPAAPGLYEPSAGYTFLWNGVSGGTGGDTSVESYEIKPTATLRVEAKTAFDQKVTGADLGYFFSAAVA